jgi:hypothetical protein
VALLAAEGFALPVPVAVGMSDAAQLFHTAGPEFRRPSTMALWVRSLQAAGASVERVLITRLGGWAQPGAAAGAAAGLMHGPACWQVAQRCSHACLVCTLPRGAAPNALPCSQPRGPPSQPAVAGSSCSPAA